MWFRRRFVHVGLWLQVLALTEVDPMSLVPSISACEKCMWPRRVSCSSLVPLLVQGVELMVPAGLPGLLPLAVVKENISMNQGRGH